MSQPEYTADQLMAGIANAIKARDFEAVEGLLMLLAIEDPHQAEVVLETLKAVTGARSR